MDKVLVEVFIPKLETSYEMYIPINKSVNLCRKIIIEMINEVVDNSIPEDNSVLLYDKETGILIDHNKIVKDSGLENGSRLVLV